MEAIPATPASPTLREALAEPGVVRSLLGLFLAQASFRGSSQTILSH